MEKELKLKKRMKKCIQCNCMLNDIQICMSTLKFKIKLYCTYPSSSESLRSIRMDIENLKKSVKSYADFAKKNNIATSTTIDMVNSVNRLLDDTEKDLLDLSNEFE